jgi:hypothetical protein
MPDGRGPGEYGPILSEVNDRDTPALLRLTDQLAQQPALGLELVTPPDRLPIASRILVARPSS